MHDPQQLLRRVAILEALLASVPDPVVLVGADGLVMEANAAARALLPALRVGHPVSYGVRAPEILDAVATIRPGGTVRVEYRTRVPTERTFEVEITGLPEDRGVALFFRDLTAARRLERMRVDFVANVSHELRTPLASLLGFIETLQGHAREDRQVWDRFLAIMRDQAWRMTRLIDDLLSLSRIELREHLAPKAPVDLRPLTEQIIEALTPMAREHGVAIAFAAPQGPATVAGDSDELLRVIENLLENAIKYGQSGGRVEVGLAGHAGEIELSVRDYGPGIAHEHLPRLTERFYRVDAAASRDKGGTGLGLAIVKHIVNRHRGRLAIESEPGRGALFRVSLPAWTGSAPPA
ncbi:MAG TPA: ATP-binding protein [Microvirga sp.]|nr:ATP-binding protein [Microvirga sp.]